MPDLDKAVLPGADVEIHIAAAAQRIVFREAAEGDDAAFPRARQIDGIEDIGRPPRAAYRDDKITRAGVQIELSGETLVVPEIVAEGGQGRGIVERHRAQAAVFQVIDRHVAGDRRAAAIADEHDLVAGGVRLARRARDPRKPFIKRQRRAVLVADRGLAQQIRENGNISTRVCRLAGAHGHFSIPVIALTSEALSTERRCPTISTFSAPTTLPTKPTWCAGPPAATSGAGIDRKASPAPTVSTT